MLADVLDTYSQSSTLAGIFSQLGITAGRDTYSRYRMTIVDIAKENGIQSPQLDKLSVVSVDNREVKINVIFDVT